MPENELQKQIYDCIAAVLGHRRFGIDTELYEAGLDSLGSVLLLTDLYQILKISMTLNDLLQHASVLKLEKFAQEVYLKDLDKTVNFVPNYDETEKEPEVLPVRVPNLLVNGAEGIAVGMSTSIPTHNLGEDLEFISISLL